MEAYAGFITHTDFEIGRLLDVVQRLPGADNTLILYIAGDNGAPPGVPDGTASAGVIPRRTSWGTSMSWAALRGTTGRLLINGRDVGRSELTQTLGAGYDETFGVGRAFGPPVSSVFRPPFWFSGILKQVKIELR